MYRPLTKHPATRFFISGSSTISNKDFISNINSTVLISLIFLTNVNGVLLGSQFKLGHTHYWLYDKPHTVKQELSLAFYRDVEFINDNLVEVSQPDFGVLSFNITSKNLRRTIGSSDFENGDQFSVTLNLFATQFDSLQGLLNGYVELR